MYAEMRTEYLGKKNQEKIKIQWGTRLRSQTANRGASYAGSDAQNFGGDRPSPWALVVELWAWGSAVLCEQYMNELSQFYFLVHKM